MSARLVLAAVQAQSRMSRRNVEDLLPLLTIPLSSFVSLAILQHSGRADLAAYALVATTLMTIGQMSTFVGSEIMANERQGQMLELAVASPSAYVIPLLARVTALTATGAVGLVGAWGIARLVFDIRAIVYHPVVLLVTLAVTVMAASATALITSTIFCFGKTTRTYQNAIPGPLYLLGGVLVPVTYLPAIVRPVSPFIFFYWSADLLRASFAPAPIAHAALRLGAIGALGMAGGTIGAFLLRRLLDHLRREGTLGL